MELYCKAVHLPDTEEDIADTSPFPSIYLKRRSGKDEQRFHLLIITRDEQ
jgi:hypothetical protein